MKTRILTGCGCLDNNLGGGIAPETITLIYGESETGKTTLAIQCAVNCAMQGLKTLFVDCDNTFSTKRLNQVSAGKFEEVAELILLVKPKDFAEQTVLVDHLQDYVAKNFGLVVVDTFNSLYRARVAEAGGKAFGLNRELNRQMALLAQAAKTLRIPVVVTSQVKSVVNESFVSVAPVATRVMQFWADNIVALKPTGNPTVVEAVVEKKSGADRNTKEGTCYLRIAETGIRDYEPRR
ncbi:MAG: ATPase domain-containing protein [Candidatus Bathyarchaeia archaeon]